MLFLLSDLRSFPGWWSVLNPPSFLLLGVIQIVEVILNRMVLMCIVASYFVLASSVPALPVAAALGTTITHHLRAPESWSRFGSWTSSTQSSGHPWYGVAVSLGLGVLTLGVLLQGAKVYINCQEVAPPWRPSSASWPAWWAPSGHRHLPPHSCPDQCHRHLQNKRERVYARQDFTWMNCQLAGTDGAAATFGILLVVMYGASVVLALRSYREQSSTRTARNSREITMMHQNTCGLEYSEILEPKVNPPCFSQRWVH